MKKIINGKLYDTTTAKELGSWSNAGNWRDFSHMEETLYRKRTGEFFLHGEGGPMTKYAESAGQNSWTGGERIIPLSAAKAMEWAEEKLDADDYAEIFGLPSEDDGDVALFVRIPATLDAKLRATAADLGMSLTAYVTDLLDRIMND